MLTTFAVLAGLLAPPAATGTIDVDVTPANAIIEVDGKAVLSHTVKVKAGSHKVTARAKGYASQTRNVTVSANQKARVAFRLTKAGTVKPPVVKGPDVGGGSKTPTVGGGGGGKTPTVKGGSKTPIVIGKGKTVDEPVKPGIKTTPKTTPKVTPKAKNDDGPTVVKRPRTGPATGKRNPPARGNVNTGGGARGRRDTGSQSLRPWAVLSFVVGGLAITGGVITHGIAEDKAEEFNASRDRQEKLKLHDEAKGFDTASTVLYGVGATGVALGILLLAVDPGDSRAMVSPLPEGGAMIGYGGTF